MNLYAIADIVAGDPSKRYALSDEAKQTLRELGNSMNTKGRSKEWNALKLALTDPGLEKSDGVFDAVEAYLKGKKAVSSDPKRQGSVDLALQALAVAAESGDEANKQRAQTLVDRFNKVRGTKPGDKDYVDLNDFAPKGKEPQVPEANAQEVVPQ